MISATITEHVSRQRDNCRFLRVNRLVRVVIGKGLFRRNNNDIDSSAKLCAIDTHLPIYHVFVAPYSSIDIARYSWEF